MRHMTEHCAPLSGSGDTVLHSGQRAIEKHTSSRNASALATASVGAHPNPCGERREAECRCRPFKQFGNSVLPPESTIQRGEHKPSASRIPDREGRRPSAQVVSPDMRGATDFLAFPDGR